MMRSAERKGQHKMSSVSSEHTDMNGVWDRIKIYCLSHKDPVPMEIIKNTEYIKTPFYACEHYMGKGGDGDICPNRLNLDDYQGILYKFFDLYAQTPFADLTGRTYTYHRSRQKIFVKVIMFSDEEIRLGVRNLTVMGPSGKAGS